MSPIVVQNKIMIFFFNIFKILGNFNKITTGEVMLELKLAT